VVLLFKQFSFLMVGAEKIAQKCRGKITTACNIHSCHGWLLFGCIPFMSQHNNQPFPKSSLGGESAGFTLQDMWGNVKCVFAGWCAHMPHLSTLKSFCHLRIGKRGGKARGREEKVIS
jgi:hypothetical protein